MRNPLHFLPGLLLFWGAVPCLAFALQNPVPDGKQQQTRAGAQEEKEDYYKKWLEQDVVYIITEAERSVFLELTTDEERDNFIEQFWRRRDTDTRTAINEFKEEHYRRIAYANEHYYAGIPGWMTDRGRIYIVFGPPDRVESYPMGGSYDRQPHEGGGWTSVFPFERWEYRYIEGAGTDVELEFVDTAGGNLYHLTMDPQEKDEYRLTPGQGFTDAELFDPNLPGRALWKRVHGIRTGGTAMAYGNYEERLKDDPFQRAELLMNISKPPLIHYNDLKELVETSVSYEQLPFQVVHHLLPGAAGTLLVPLTLSLNNQDLQFEQTETAWHSLLHVYGQITTQGKRVVYEFDDEIRADYALAAGQESALPKGSALYQRKLALPPGRFKLTLVVKDMLSDKVGTRASLLNVPEPPADELSVSSIILTKNIEPAGNDSSAPFVVGEFKIRPQVDALFDPEDYLGFYVEATNLQVDQSTLEPDVEIEFGIAPRGGSPDSPRIARKGIGVAADRVYVGRMLQLTGLETGKYDLVCSILDKLSGKSVASRAPFEIR